MSYRAGIGVHLAAQLGREPGGPQIRCDSPGCEYRIVFTNLPPSWFLNRKPKPGWSLIRTENDDGTVTLVDLCPIHRAKMSRRK